MAVCLFFFGATKDVLDVLFAFLHLVTFGPGLFKLVFISKGHLYNMTNQKSRGLGSGWQLAARSSARGLQLEELELNLWTEFLHEANGWLGGKKGAGDSQGFKSECNPPTQTTTIHVPSRGAMAVGGGLGAWGGRGSPWTSLVDKPI